MIALAGVGAERLASSWTLTAKSLRPLPEKFRGLTDAEHGSPSSGPINLNGLAIPAWKGCEQTRPDRHPAA